MVHIICITRTALQLNTEGLRSRMTIETSYIQERRQRRESANLTTNEHQIGQVLSKYAGLLVVCERVVVQ